MSSTVKRSSRTTLRNLISGGGRKGKDKGSEVLAVSVPVSTEEDLPPKTSNSNANGGGDRANQQQQPTTRQSQQQRTVPDGGPTPSASATKSKEKSSRSSNATNTREEVVTTRSSNNAETNGPESTTAATRGRSTAGSGGGNVLQRLRERSRSRSRTRKETGGGSTAPTATKELLVAVTSCRSDGYYSQKAPGSISKLPRKAPTNLKLFHELAVGVKDAYSAVGATPRNPEQEQSSDSEPASSSSREARLILWDFIGNLDFVRDCY
jgi:hypothetical protein